MRAESDSTKSFEVRFAKHGGAVFGLDLPRIILIWPSDDRWNDQGFRVLVRLVVKVDDSIFEPTAPAILVAEGFKDSGDAIDSLFAGELASGQSVEGWSKKGWFATMLGQVGDYRGISRAFGPDVARSALDAMHDIVVESRKAAPAGWLASTLRSDAFKLGVLRQTARYFAYRRALDALEGNEREAIERASANATLRFELGSFAGPHEIPLSFGKSGFFHRRINVLIGRNGVGKSQTLAHLIAALSGGRPKLKATIEPRGEFSRVIAFSGIASQTALPRKLAKRADLQYHYFGLAPDKPKKGTDHPLTLALVDLVRSDDSIGEVRRIEMFSRAVVGWLPLDQIAVPLVDPKDRRHFYREFLGSDQTAYMRLTDIGRAGEQEQLSILGAVDLNREPGFIFLEDKIVPLSSGQELFFRFALHLCTSIEAGTLVLIDEPENHLHPNFITGLMALLRTVLKETGSFALIATHSPFVVREVTHHDVCVLVRDEDAMPIVSRPRLHTLGANVAAVSMYVFGDETLPTLARLTSNELQSSEISNVDQILIRMSEEYSNEALSYIRGVAMSRRYSSTDSGESEG